MLSGIEIDESKFAGYLPHESRQELRSVKNKFERLSRVPVYTEKKMRV